MPTQKAAKNNKNKTSVQLRSFSISCQPEHLPQSIPLDGRPVHPSTL